MLRNIVLGFLDGVPIEEHRLAIQRKNDEIERIKKQSVSVATQMCSMAYFTGVELGVGSVTGHMPKLN